MPVWETLLISWVSVGVPGILGYGIRRMMIAIGKILDYDDRLTVIEAKLDKIDGQTNGH